MGNRFIHTLQLGFALLDFLAMNAVFFIAEFIFRRHGLISYDIEYVYFIFFLNAAWLGIALTKRIYNEEYLNSFELFSKVTMRAYMWLLLVMVICLFFLRWMMLSRIFIVTVLGAVFLSLIANRLTYLVLYHYFRKNTWMNNKVVIIGYNNLSKRLVDYLASEGMNKEVVGFCEEYENIHELSAYPILSNVSGAMEVCKKFQVTEIYSTIAPEQNQHLYELIQSADDNCIRFKIVPDLGFFFKRQMHIDYLKEIPVISMRKEPLEELSNRIKKRMFDMVVSAIVVVAILSWLIPLIGLLIKLESRGPVFFSQRRSGKNNRSFWCLKFRSMRQNGDADTQQASKNDMRVTRIGRFLRRTSLDEFPQFINVLRGDMSIVGPRPHMLKHTDEYSRQITKYMVRQFLKPGITGWAQVSGYRGETQTVLQMQRRVEHDLWYMENWSLYFDVKIVFMTVVNTMRGEKNAY